MFKKYSSKTLFVSLFIVIFGINSLTAQTNLERANNYYDADDYPHAIEFFEKTIFEDKQYNGTIFYRYAYSLEQNNVSEDDYSQFYSASAFLFENENDKENKYYSYAIAKEEKLNISHKKFSAESIQRLLNGEKIQTRTFIQSTVTCVDKLITKVTERVTSELLIIYAIVVIIIYIIGRVFSKRTECVILSSVKEILLLYTPCFLMIVIFFLTLLSISFNETTMAFMFIIAFFISFISAIVFSIYENIGTKNPVLYITVSIITKLALFIIAPIVLILSTAGMKASVKDKRFRDGTKNNQKTKNIAIAISVIAGLIISLIKTPRKKIEEDIADW